MPPDLESWRNSLDEEFSLYCDPWPHLQTPLSELGFFLWPPTQDVTDPSTVNATAWGLSQYNYCMNYVKVFASEDSPNVRLALDLQVIHMFYYQTRQTWRPESRVALRDQLVKRKVLTLCCALPLLKVQNGWVTNVGYYTNWRKARVLIIQLITHYRCFTSSLLGTSCLLSSLLLCLPSWTRLTITPRLLMITLIWCCKCSRYVYLVSAL